MPAPKLASPNHWLYNSSATSLVVTITSPSLTSGLPDKYFKLGQRPHTCKGHNLFFSQKTAFQFPQLALLNPQAKATAIPKLVSTQNKLFAVWKPYKFNAVTKGPS